MERISFKGYIKFSEDIYTFVFEEKKLTLISVKTNKHNFFPEYKKVDYFEGITLDGFSISFYINDEIYYQNGCFVCSPKCIFISQYQGYQLSELKFDAMSIIGGNLNRFYSNRNMIEINFDENSKIRKEFLNFKSVEETVTEEVVKLNNKKTTFELSIIQPGWEDDGSITFDDYDTLLRIKYEESQGYKLLLKNLINIESFFKFCSNRNRIFFKNIFLECKNDEGKYIKTAKIIMPFNNEEYINKDMIEYEAIKGHIEDLINFLNSSDYVFSIIPDDNNDFSTVSNKDFCAAFSCFESIYQYIHSGDIQKVEMSKSEIELEEVKKEILPFLKSCDEKYVEVNRLRRDFIKRFINIISKANLKKEKCILNEVMENKFIIDTIYYKTRNEIKEKGIEIAINKAVLDRDNITHNMTMNLDNISKGIYQIILKLNYVMILKYVGIPEEKIKWSIEYLAQRNII